jgi:hypothetical protein
MGGQYLDNGGCEKPNSLLNTIMIPKNLIKLAEHLPKANYDDEYSDFEEDEEE